MRKREGVVLRLVVAGVVALAAISVWAFLDSPPAAAATSPCGIYAHAPTTNGLTMNAGGQMACPSGRTVQLIKLRLHRQLLGIWTQWTNPLGTQAHACSGSSDVCIKWANPLWNCNGAGNPHWRSWAEGTDNHGDTKATYSSSKELEC